MSSSSLLFQNSLIFGTIINPKLKKKGWFFLYVGNHSSHSYIETEINVNVMATEEPFGKFVFDKILKFSLSHSNSNNLWTYSLFFMVSQPWCWNNFCNPLHKYSRPFGLCWTVKLHNPFWGPGPEHLNLFQMSGYLCCKFSYWGLISF